MTEHHETQTSEQAKAAESLSYFSRLSKVFGWRYVSLVVLVYGVNQGMGEGWGFFAKDYFFSDDPPKGLGVSAAKLGAFSGLINIPWQIKSIYGILSDALPIRHFHRTPYLILSSMLGTIGWLFLGIFPVGVAVASLMLVLANYSIASPDVMIDASVAEFCNAYPAYASDLQSLCWGSYGVGAIAASISAGWLYDSPLGSHGLFALTSLTSVVILLPSIFGWLGEKEDKDADVKKSHLRARIRRKLSCIFGLCCSAPTPVPVEVQLEQEMVLLPSQQDSSATSQQPIHSTETTEVTEDSVESNHDNLFVLSFLLCIISISVGSSLSYFTNVPVQIFAYVATVAAVCAAVYLMERNISNKLAKASMYIFLRGAIQPSSSVTFYWSKYTEENCEGEFVDRPCFSPEFLSAMEVVGYIFFVAGTAVYNRYLSKWSYRKIWTASQIALIFANLLDFVWVMRWNLTIGVSDKVFVIGDEVVGKMISRLNTMPLFILAAKLCPKGYEATLFAMNMGLSNFGAIVGGYLGTIVLEVMQVSRPAFDGLELYVFLRSLTRILPVFLIPYLVPHGTPSDVESVDEDENLDPILTESSTSSNYGTPGYQPVEQEIDEH